MVFEGDGIVIRACVAVLGRMEAGLCGGREEVLGKLGWVGSNSGGGSNSNTSSREEREVKSQVQRDTRGGVEAWGDPDRFMEAVREAGKEEKKGIDDD